MARWKNVAIIGVGLIGGSIGLAIRQRGVADEVIGIGRRKQSLQAAKKIGAVTRATIDLRRGVAQAELVIVCTPVAKIVGHVKAAAAACPPGALITDVGSTKAEIVRQLDGALDRGVRFLGSHPLAGSHKTGAAHATENLLDDRAVVLTPTRRTRPADDDRLTEFWRALGAHVVKMSPAAHDRALAVTSHLPHLVASALAGVVPERLWPLSGGALRDTTRVAESDTELWKQIFFENRRDVLAAVDRFQDRLESLRGALEQEDSRRLTKLLAQGKRRRETLGQ